MSEIISPHQTLKTPRDTAHANSELGLQQRINTKFRNAVGRDVELVLDEHIREGLSGVRREILSRIFELNLHELDAAVADPIIEEIISTRVKLFFTRSAWLEDKAIHAELRKELQVSLEDNKALNERVKKQMYDSLTGLFLRSTLMGEFKDMLVRVQREAFSKPVALAVIMIDIDNFKKINDKNGHLVGDEVIKKVGEIINNICGRQTDLKGRYGGEEFTVVLHDCNETNAIAIGEKLRAAFENSEIKITNGDTTTIKFTASIGVHSVVFHKNPFNNPQEMMRQLLDSADKNLYVSKNSGKNKVTVTTGDIGEMPDELGALL